MCDIFSTGAEYKKFETIKVFEVSDYHSKAVYLRHKVTGLDVVHLFNEDSENLFAFAFRTPNPKSNGAAHIIEHSVLCGSEKFPLKDPFVNLANQSLKTYLNAMTYPDKTIYPASSIAKNDYFNLMNVYGDAVFFPKLRKEIFMQEAHRLELDENGNPSIQGVVYNEMKGNYSSFDSVANDCIQNSLLKNSVYDKDSGGDPVEIPTITYEEFKQFHEKWYRPDNCIVFLYGNIPTEEQLDFLQDNFIDRLEKKYPSEICNPETRKERLKEFLNFVTSDEISAPICCNYEGPAGDSENESTVLVSWKIGKVENSYDSMKDVVIAGILANHDGSPLQKALMDSDLGEDTAPQCGFSSSFYDRTFTIGLRGVKKTDAKKVEQVVLDTLKNVVEKGVSKRDLDATLMGLEISQREIKRGHGPFSIALMTRLVTGWAYGYDVENQIRSRRDLENVKKEISENPDYLVDLIRNKFLDNPQRALIVVTPSKKFNEKREKQEKELLEKLLSETSVEQIKKDCDMLHEFQGTEEDVSCLPHLNPKDFIKDGKPFLNKVKIDICETSACDGKNIPLLVNEENTNGIVYFDLGFPVDCLEAEDYPLLSLLSDCVTECGWKDLDWAKAAEETALHTGGIGAHLLTMDGPSTEISRKFCEQHKWTNRDWLVFRMFMIEEECENALKLLSDCITGVDFSDYKRIRDIVTETKNDLEASVVPEGHIYVSSRVCSGNSKKSAIDEIWNGITQLYVVQKTCRLEDEKISQKFSGLFEKIRNSGAIIHITAEKSGLDLMEKLLPEFISKTGIVSLKEPCANSLEKFKSVIAGYCGCKELEQSETFTLEAQVGFAACSIPAAPYGTKDCAADEVCAHWLSNNLLWEKIRTIGGAYGAFCNPETCSELMLFATYRDPSPFDSCETFKKCVEECAEMDFSQEEIEKAVMGCYSHFIQPQAPKGRGSTSFTRALYGITDEDRERKVKWLLELTNSDVKNAFVRMAGEMKDSKDSAKNRSAVICGRGYAEQNASKQEKYGKITNLSL
ncbi:MAG: insulinase family protein [Treponema sp.]|nr:insulinase family protein [Candidatus Treponema equifaecale]